jgi:hypothetical protein
MNSSRVVFAIGLVALLGCSSPSDGGGDASAAHDAATVDAAASDVGVDAGSPSAQPPPSAGPSAPDGTGDVTFAITRWRLGTTDPDGTPDTTHGWTHYGYDIDHRASTAASTDLCATVNNASRTNVYPDGIDGRDDSFGHDVLPILMGLSSNYETAVNDSVLRGGETLLFTLHQLGTSDHDDPLQARMVRSTALGSTPRFDGTDVYGVEPGSLTTPTDATTARVTFAAYLVGNTFVGVASTRITVHLADSNFHLALPIDHAVVTMHLDATHRHATGGVIAGVMPTTELTANFRQAMGSIMPTLCSGATSDAILTQVQQASDILTDETQDPAMSCTAVSIGLGFDAEPVQLGAVGTAVADPMPCH